MKNLNEQIEKINRLTNYQVGVVISEQKSSNQFKEQIADLIEEINSSMSSDMWRDADDLMMIYKKLLPLKGKTVQPGEISRYKEMDADEQKTMSALSYFNMMYGRGKDNEYGMGQPFNFIERIGQVGNRSITGGEEKTKDGKYTTQQVKKMIIDLVNNG